MGVGQAATAPVAKQTLCINLPGFVAGAHEIVEQLGGCLHPRCRGEGGEESNR